MPEIRRNHPELRRNARRVSGDFAAERSAMPSAPDTHATTAISTGTIRSKIIHGVGKTRKRARFEKRSVICGHRIVGGLVLGVDKLLVKTKRKFLAMEANA